MNKEALLAARMCPRNFAEFVGQEHLVGENSGVPFKHYYITLVVNNGKADSEPDSVHITIKQVAHLVRETSLVAS